MTFFDRFFRSAPNPTKDWPIVELSQPEIDMYHVHLGTLRFGDDLRSAQCLGRPDVFRGKEEEYCELIYARAGFQVDFDSGRLVYIAFFIGPDKEALSLPQIVFSQPHITGAGNLTSNITEAKLRDWLGSPGDQEKSPEETVLFYPVAENTMEFEFNSEGCLKRWNLYPQKEKR